MRLGGGTASFPYGNTITVAAALPPAADASTTVFPANGPGAAAIDVTGVALVAGGVASFLARRRRLRGAP